ncbi:MAG: hypothetical protein WCK39_07540 [Methanomassiliicoccales archaeon]
MSEQEATKDPSDGMSDDYLNGLEEGVQAIYTAIEEHKLTVEGGGRAKTASDVAVDILARIGEIRAERLQSRLGIECRSTPYPTKAAAIVSE